VVDDFKGGKNGYRGHHTKQSDDLNIRTFEVIIKTPEGLIFDGTASFTLQRQFLPSEKAKIGDCPEATVVRADRNSDSG
jgi:hypothetical protein